jgi:hypothetical protein
MYGQNENVATQSPKIDCSEGLHRPAMVDVARTCCTGLGLNPIVVIR